MMSRVAELGARRTTAAVLLLILAFTAGRAYLLVSSLNYPGSNDVDAAYAEWADDILIEGKAPYTDAEIEYPPAALPFLLGPGLIDATPQGYRPGFVFLMLAIDVIGFVLLLRLGQRRGTLLGAWLWVIALQILGPLVYLRFDLVPAVATVGFVSRADRDDWLGAGALLGLAIATKAYAVVLVPLAFIMCPALRRKHLAIGLVALLLLPLIPFVADLGAVSESVVGYHQQRGIQIESLWGSILFIVRSLDRVIRITLNYGAHHFEGGVVPTLKTLATLVTIGVTAALTWIASRLPRKPEALAAAAFTTLTLVVAVASVFSPQFMIWVIALAAAATVYPDSRIATQALLIVGVTAVTRLIYPTLHADLVRTENLAIIVVWFRNLSLLLIGIYAAVRLYESVSAPSTEAAASEGTQ